MRDEGTRKRRRRTRRRRAKLDMASVQRAIYLDFEGRTDSHPVLLGEMTPPPVGPGLVRQHVVDRWFQMFGDATGCRTESLETFVLCLVQRAELEDRRIVTWSEHDLEVVKHYCSRDTATRFAARYKNARAFAERWRKALYPDVNFDSRRRKENALASYLEFIEIDVPEEFGPGLTGEHLRRLEGPASRGKPWNQLSKDQRSYWSAILGHNQYDVVGMYEVCRRAAIELSSTRPDESQSGQHRRRAKRPPTRVELDSDGGAVRFDGFELRQTGEFRLINGQTTSGQAAEGRAHIFEVSGDGFAVEVGLVTWSTGDQDIQMLSRIEGDEPLDGLTRRLRISIREWDEERWMELEQARLNGSGRPSSRKASLEELDEGAGLSTAKIIRELGGDVGTREDLLQDESRRRSWICTVFPEESSFVPVAAFAISRIAPILRGHDL